MAITSVIKPAAQRLKDAKKMEFMTGMPLYHGTNKDIAEFSLEHGGAVSRSPVGKLGVSLSVDPETASEFANQAGKEGANVIQAYHRASKPVQIDLDGSEMNHEIAATVRYAWDQGYDAIKFNNYTTPAGKKGKSFVLVKDPNQIRSVNAEFDPNKKNLANLLAGVGGVAVGVTAMDSEAAGFDPDAFIAKRQDSKTATGFDPDAFITKRQTEQRPKVTGGRGIAAQEHRRREYDFEQYLGKLREESKQTGIPLARDIKEIGAAPELNALNWPAVKASASGLFTFDDKELGDMLTNQVGAEIIQDGEGNYIAKMPSGGFYAINKPDFSGQDLAKFTANAALFTPTGKAKALRMAAGGAARQTGIESAQVSEGGEFNPEEIAMSTAAPIVMEGVVRGGKSLISSVKNRPKATESYLSNVTQKSIENTTDDVSSIGNKVGRVKENKKMADIRQSMNEGSVESVGWKLDKSGRIVKDSLQRELVKSGVNDHAVVVLRDMTKTDKAAAKRMLSLAEANIKKIRGSERMRPSVVIGDNAMKRFDVIRSAKDDAQKQITAAVKNDLSGKPVEISNLVDDFIDKLDGLGVRVEDGRLKFQGSMISGSNTGPLRRVFDALKTNYDDAAELHKLKKFITKQIDYDRKQGLTRTLDDEAESALKSLRAGINEKLRSMSDSYSSGNDKFAKAAESLKPFYETMGRRFDPESERVFNFVGKELRKTLSNYAKADDLITAIDGLDATAREFGGEFADDIMSQVVLNSELERIFGSFAPNSLQGVGEKVAGIGAQRALGLDVVEVAKTAKDHLIFEPPSKEKLMLLKKLKELVGE